MSAYRARVTLTHGTLHGLVTSQRRHRCDGHLTNERHWIMPGDRYVAGALPPDHPDIGNTGWLHLRLCMDCAPIEYADGAR
jgi:hypothetical protein